MNEIKEKIDNYLRYNGRKPKYMVISEDIIKKLVEDLCVFCNVPKEVYHNTVFGVKIIEVTGKNIIECSTEHE